jgi:hypothetical protein
MQTKVHANNIEKYKIWTDKYFFLKIEAFLTFLHRYQEMCLRSKLSKGTSAFSGTDSEDPVEDTV